MIAMKKQRPPALIDGWLGTEARLLERHESRVAAPPERVAEAVEQVRLMDMPIVRLLFIMRGIRHSKDMTLRQFFSTPPSSPDPDQFHASGQPGTVRTIANLRVDTTENGSLMSTETWVETFGHRA